MPRKIKILFLCTGNSCRSQIAEGWARALKSDLIEPFSAGLEAQGHLSARSVNRAFRRSSGFSRVQKLFDNPLWAGYRHRQSD